MLNLTGESVLQVASQAKTAILIHRHYDYLSGHVAIRHLGEDVYALNYSQREPKELFILSKAGIMQGWAHGRAIAEAGMEVAEIIGSHQGRGPESGIRISEGYHEVSGMFIPVRLDHAVDYPVYNFDAVSEALTSDNNAFVGEWLNGKQPNLVRSDTPESFRDRVTRFIDTLKKEKGIRIISTHFEIVSLCHGLYVEGKNLSELDESFDPPKGGGIILCKDPSGWQAYDYNSDLQIV